MTDYFNWGIALKFFTWTIVIIGIIVNLYIFNDTSDSEKPIVLNEITTPIAPVTSSISEESNPRVRKEAWIRRHGNMTYYHDQFQQVKTSNGHYMNTIKTPFLVDYGFHDCVLNRPHVLIIMHSRKDPNFFSHYTYAHKCLDYKGALYFRVRNPPRTTSKSFNFPKYPFDDDQWLLTILDCPNINECGDLDDLPFGCNSPEKFTKETCSILAESKEFEIIWRKEHGPLSFYYLSYREIIPPKDGAIISSIAYFANTPSNRVISNQFDYALVANNPANLLAFLGNSYHDPGYCIPLNDTASSSFDNFMFSGGMQRKFYCPGNMFWKEQQYRCTETWHYDPSGRSRIPVTGVWGDLEYGHVESKDSCVHSPQDTFVFMYNLPPSDPRHPSQVRRRQGVYSSNMFLTPDGENGIHFILMDTQTHRSPVRNINRAKCERSKSTFLGAEQWKWLEKELMRDSEVKIIGSSIPILPPLHVSNPKIFCAYDGPGGTFEQAIKDVNEDADVEGPTYQVWADIPQERTRLLRLCQKSLNDGHAQKVIFITGNKYVSEIMTKKMKESVKYGKEQTLTEVSISSEPVQDRTVITENSNRVHVSEIMTKQMKEIVKYGKEQTFTDSNRARGDGIDYGTFGDIRVNWEYRTIYLAIYPYSTTDPYSTPMTALDVTLSF